MVLYVMVFTMTLGVPSACTHVKNFRVCTHVTTSFRTTHTHRHTYMLSAFPIKRRATAVVVFGRLLAGCSDSTESALEAGVASTNDRARTMSPGGHVFNAVRTSAGSENSNSA